MGCLWSLVRGPSSCCCLWALRTQNTQSLMLLLASCPCGPPTTDKQQLLLQLLQYIAPHSLQWCRRRSAEKGAPHPKHSTTSESDTHTAMVRSPSKGCRLKGLDTSNRKTLSLAAGGRLGPFAGGPSGPLQLLE